MGWLDNLLGVNDPSQAASLALGTNLLSTGGPSRMPISTGQAIGNALMGARDTAVGTQNDILKRQLIMSTIAEHMAQAQQRDMLARELQRKAEQQQKFQDYIGSLGKQSYAPGATVMRPETMVPRTKQFDVNEFLQMGGSPEMAKQYQEAANYDPDPISHYANVMTPQGERIVGITKSGKQRIFDLTPRPAQPPANVSVSVSNEKGLDAKLIDLGTKSYESTQNAPANLSLIRNMRDALESGAFVGPGATAEQFFAQLGNKMNVGGKDAAEKLANTRSLIMNSAKINLGAAQMLNGQGSVSNYERQAVEKASAPGGIESMSPVEWKYLVQGLDKVERARIQSHNAKINSFKKVPNMPGPAFDALMINEPAPLTPFSNPLGNNPEPAPRLPMNRPPVRFTPQ